MISKIILLYHLVEKFHLHIFTSVEYIQYAYGKTCTPGNEPRSERREHQLAKHHKTCRRAQQCPTTKQGGIRKTGEGTTL